LSRHFPDRTVVTYDPRGVERSANRLRDRLVGHWVLRLHASPLTTIRRSARQGVGAERTQRGR
jgi:hypothetical protein